MAGRMGFAQRFMRITGKLRMFFGPAQTGSLDHPMTDGNKQLLRQQESDARQWVTKRRPDGSTYIVLRSKYPDQA